MDEIIQNLNAWSSDWLALMWAFLWQSTLLVGLAAVLAALLRRSSPVLRWWLWQIVAVKLLMMPFWTLAIELPAWADITPMRETAVVAQRPLSGPGTPHGVTVSPLAESARAPAPAGVATPTPAPPSWHIGDITWSSWLLSGWAAVVAMLLARLIRQRIRLGRLLRAASPAGDELSRLLLELSQQLGLRRCPAVVLTGARCPLFVCGLLCPTIVSPRTLVESLDSSKLRQVLLHELAHVKRHDLLWGWPVEIGRMLYFFHPAVYWVGYCLRLERELACDQQAMALGGNDPADYADTLVDVASHPSQWGASRAAAAISAG